MEWRLDSTRVMGVEELSAREARLADLPAILDVEAKAHPTPWTREVFAREFDLDWSYLWVLTRSDDPDDIVGFLVFWVIHDEVHILNVAVHPDMRRRGIATAIIEFLIVLATEREASFVTLEVREHNRPAIALYESLGFDIMGRRERYYSDTGEDALLMSRIL